MDSRDIFRRFFGFPNRHPGNFGADDDFPREDRGNNHPCEDDDDGFNFSFDSSRGLEDMFEHFHGDMWRQMESLHRQMDEMIRGFGVIDFPSSFEQPDLRNLNPGGPGKSGHDDRVTIWSNIPNPFFGHREARNPREFMLKEDADEDLHPGGQALPAPPNVGDKSKVDSVFPVPHINTPGPHSKVDTDLDGKISDNRILEMMKKPKPDRPSEMWPSMDQPRLFSSQKSVSMMTIRGADNKVEHKRTVKDSSGREESTVTRSLGDKSYSVVTVTGKDGSQERHETFKNMDERDVPKFEEEWSRRRQPPQLGPSPNTPDSMLAPRLDSEDSNLFSKFFGRRN